MSVVYCNCASMCRKQLRELAISFPFVLIFIPYSRRVQNVKLSLLLASNKICKLLNEDKILLTTTPTNKSMKVVKCYYDKCSNGLDIDASSETVNQYNDKYYTLS